MSEIKSIVEAKIQRCKELNAQINQLISDFEKTENCNTAIRIENNKPIIGIIVNLSSIAIPDQYGYTIIDEKTKKKWLVQLFEFLFKR